MRNAFRAFFLPPAAVLAALISLALPSAPAAAQPATAEEPLRAVVTQPLVAAQELIKAGKGAEALAKVREAEAVPGLNANERFTVDRLKGVIAQQAGNNALAVAALQSALGAGRFKLEERLSVLQAVTSLALQLNDPATAARRGQEFFAAGGTGDPMRLALVRAGIGLNDWALVRTHIQPVLEAAEGAGKVPTEEHLRVLAGAQLKLADEAAYQQTLEKLVRHHPKADYWVDLLGRVQRNPKLADRLILDTFRLMRHVGVVEDPDDYLNMAQLAMLAALPGEAKAVLDEGFAKAVLGKGPSAVKHRELQARVLKAAAEDQAQLATGEAAALKSGDGNRIFAVGEAYVSVGQADKGLPLMEQGLRAGVKRNPDDAKLRYGAALGQAGRRADAEAQLKAVQGTDGAVDVARLWLLAFR
jgi:hypothetical protein